MEPLNPKLRKALKQAHPGLTNEDIDRCEELLARRGEYDPEKDADKIAAFDRERMALIQTCMPRYAEVARTFAVQAARAKPRPPPKVKVKRPRRP